jgi:S-formylglutathione hydrolase FrmB
MSTSTDSSKQPDTSRPADQPSARSRLRWLPPVVIIVAVVAFVAAVLNGFLGGTSIISGWFPAIFFWVTVAVCLLAVVLRRDVLREFLIGIPVAIVLAVILFIWLDAANQVPTGAPRSLYIWLAVACLVGGLVIAGWRRAHWTRRVAGLLAVVLAVVSAGSAVNQTFDYYPTFDRLLGKSANNFLDNAQLDQMRRDVIKTGKLPDHGATLAVTIPGDGLKFQPRQAYVWVPPAWFGRNQPKLPVIELLHGTPGDPSNWTKSAFADATSLAFAQQHKGVAPILVMPDSNGSWTGDSECANTALYGDVATYLSKTVPAYMQKKFNASTSPGSTAVAGLSEGGLCATTLALNNPKEYAAFGNYSGDVSPTYQYDNEQQTVQALFGGSQAAYNAVNPPYILAREHYTGLSGWFESGAQDTAGVQAAQTLQGLSVKAGISTCLATPPGNHDFILWQQAYQDSLPWLSWKLKLTPEPTSVPATCTTGH